MERVNKLQFISAIAERLQFEINQLKNWIQSEIEIEELKAKLVDDNDQNDDDQNIDREGSQNLPEESENNFQTSSQAQMPLDVVDVVIKNEAEELDEKFTFDGGTAEDYEYEDYDRSEGDEGQIKLNIHHGNSNRESQDPSSSSNSQFTMHYDHLLGRLVKKSAKKPKKLTNFCTICQIKFDSIYSLREHQEIHYKVPTNHKFVESARGNPLLEADGYLYRKSAKSQTSMYWICVAQDHEDKCHARAITSVDGVKVRLNGDHNHDVNQRGTKRKWRRSLRGEERETQNTSSEPKKLIKTYPPEQKD